MRLSIYGTALLIVIGISFCSNAQDFTNKGMDFWIGYGNHVRMFNPGDPEKMQLYITSDVNTTGQVAIASIGFSQSFSVTANQITTVDIPRTAALLDQGLYNHGIHVTAEKPIVVYSFIYVNAISGATLCLPTVTLGKEYYSVNYTQTSNENNCHSYFFVIAADTGTTTVEITPSAATSIGQAAGTPFTVNLQQGQIYQVLGETNGMAGVDLTGSKIRSISTGTRGCKRIAVYCGSSKISIGCGGTPFSSDNLYQEMYPTSTWGKKYITVPGLVNTSNFFRIIKSDPSAVVSLNGSVLSQSLFINNFYYEFSSNQPNVIESDKPILVAQYFTTQGCAGNPGYDPSNNQPGSDPEMIYLNPVEQTINNVTLNSMQPASGTSITDHFLNVVLRNEPSAINSFKIDGSPYLNFTPVSADPSYAYAQIKTKMGTHNITCDTGFNIIAYGFGNAESYGYSGGTNLKDLYQFISIHNQYGTVSYPAGCRNSPFYFSMTFPYQPTQISWLFNGLFKDTTINSPVYDSTWTVNGKQLYLYKLPKLFTVSTIGTYRIKVLAQNPTTDGCSGEQDISYDLQIYERPKSDFDFTSSGCTSDSVHFIDKSNSNSRPTIRWNWDFNDGGTANVANPVYLYKKAGTFKVKYSIITDIGCVSDTVTKSLNLSEPPIARFGIKGSSCIGEAVTFIDSSTLYSSNLIKWYWDFGDGSPQIIATTNATQTHTYAAAGNYTVTLKVETAEGCPGPVYSKQISIGVFPIAGFAMPENCLNDPFSQFTDTSSIADNTSSSFTYQWSFGDANATPANPNTATIKNPKHKYTAVGTYNIALTVTSNNGCTATKTQQFIVNGSAPKSIFEINGGNLQCSNNVISIKNNSTVDFGHIIKLEVYWDYNNDPTIKSIDDNPEGGSSYSHQYPDVYISAPKDHVLRVIAYSGESCLNTADQTLSLKTIPQIQFDTIMPVCLDVAPYQISQPVIMNNLGGIGVFSGSSVSSSGLFDPSGAGVGPHTIRYTFTADNGCSNYQDRQVNVLQVPSVDAGPDRFVLEGGNAVLLGSGIGDNLSYVWTPTIGLNNPNIPQPVVSPTNDINYTLKVTSSEGCSASDQVTVKILKTPTVPNVFTPNGDGINDRWEIKYLESYPGCTVQVYNSYGQLVFESTGYSKPWDGTYKGSQVPAGTYYYIINPKNGRKQMSGFVDVVR